MPRPTTKAQLLSEMAKEHEALERFFETLGPGEVVRPGAVGQWSAKDVLAHLTAWEQLVLGWYQAGLRGETPRTPAEDLTWAQLPALNQRIHAQHRDRPLAEVRDAFDRSFLEISAAVKGMSEDELFGRGVYAWTRTTTLGSYLTSCTSSHYRWARTEMRVRR